jgi:G3E family GTPase
LRVGIVTNDQTTDLVDTQSLRSQGFDVGEVAGACFCCSFNELTATVDRLAHFNPPDVIIAEPVGSCTDLVATVIRPLNAVYERPMEMAPYGVLLKPSHGLKILRNEPGTGFSPKAAYIFTKQLEEADFMVINRIDELSSEVVTELEMRLKDQFPGRPILKMSAKSGLGFDGFIKQLSTPGNYGRRVLEMDYDLYAEGEAELGWLNSQSHVESTTPFSLDALLLRIAERLSETLAEAEAETARRKSCE